MKATITYNLPEDAIQFKRASKSTDMTQALEDISQYLRVVDKYEKGDTIEQIRERFREILEEHDINLDNLIE